MVKGKCLLQVNESAYRLVEYSCAKEETGTGESEVVEQINKN